MLLVQVCFILHNTRTCNFHNTRSIAPKTSKKWGEKKGGGGGFGITRQSQNNPLFLIPDSYAAQPRVLCQVANARDLVNAKKTPSLPKMMGYSYNYVSEAHEYPPLLCLWYQLLC